MISNSKLTEFFKAVLLLQKLTQNLNMNSYNMSMTALESEMVFMKRNFDESWSRLDRKKGGGEANGGKKPLFFYRKL